MVHNLIEYPIETDRLEYEVRHVLRDISETPHLLMRVTLTGTEFPHRAPEPYLRVGDVESRFVQLSEDGTVAKAYFDQPLAEGAPVEFGYDAEPPVIRLRDGIRLKGLDALDPERIPDNTRFADRFFEDGEPIIR